MHRTRTAVVVALLWGCAKSITTDAGDEDTGTDSAIDIGLDAGEDADVDAYCPDLGPAHNCTCGPSPYVGPFPSTFQLRGIVHDLDGPLAGARITAYEAHTGVLLASADSGTDGTYVLTVPTGGNAVYIYETFEKSGHWTEISCTAAPVFTDFNDFGPVILPPVDFTSYIDNTYTISGVIRDSTRGTATVIVGSCHPPGGLGDTSIETVPESVVRYLVPSDGGVTYTGAHSDAWTGGAVALNVPSGIVMFKAIVSGTNRIELTCPVLAGPSYTDVSL